MKNNAIFVKECERVLDQLRKEVKNLISDYEEERSFLASGEFMQERICTEYTAQKGYEAEIGKNGTISSIGGKLVVTPKGGEPFEVMSCLMFVYSDKNEIEVNGRSVFFTFDDNSITDRLFKAVDDVYGDDRFTSANMAKVATLKKRIRSIETKLASFR